MKRYSVVKTFNKCFKDSDLIVITGNDLCREFYEYDRPGNLYLKENFGTAISFAVGLAMCTDKRVFVFTGEGDLLREFSAIPHSAVSKCKNLFIVVLNNGIYQSVDSMPNIFDQFSSPKVVFFQFGFITHDLTDYIKKTKLSLFKDFLDRIRGPMAIIIDVDRGLKKDLKELDLDYEQHAKDFLLFVISFDLETALYEPPNFLTPGKEEINSINLNEISGGI